MPTNDNPNPPAAVEDNAGMTGTMTGKEVFAQSPQHAAELAQKGVKTTQLPTTEIIRLAREAAQKR